MDCRCIRILVRASLVWMIGGAHAAEIGLESGLGVQGWWPLFEPGCVRVCDDFVATGHEGGLLLYRRGEELRTWASAVPLPGEVKDVCQDGEVAVVALGYAGYAVLDVRAIDRPRLIGVHRAGLLGSVGGVEIDDGRVYLAVHNSDYFEGNGGLEILDIEDPAHPSTLGVLIEPAHAPTHAGRWEDPSWYALEIEIEAGRIGECEILVAAGSDSFQIVDVTDAQAPEKLAGIPVEDECLGRSLSLGGGRLFTVGCSISMYDIEASENPTLLHRETVPGISGFVGKPYRLAQQGDRLYCTTIYYTTEWIEAGAGIVVYDIADHQWGEEHGRARVNADFAGHLTPFPGGVVVAAAKAGVIGIRDYGAERARDQFDRSANRWK